MKCVRARLLAYMGWWGPDELSVCLCLTTKLDQELGFSLGFFMLVATGEFGSGNTL